MLALLLGVALRANAQDSAYLLRYEALHYASFLEVLQHHAITEELSSEKLDVSIYSYRLDQKREYGNSVDSVVFGRNTLPLGIYSLDSLQTLRESLTSSPTAQALASHSLKYFGTIDTIAGLPSYSYVIEDEGNREYLVWLAEAPPGLENLLICQTVEYAKRSGSFLMEEELHNMIRLILLKGVDFPPNSGSEAKAFILTRYDTAVNPEILNIRGNSYLYELKSLTGAASSTD